MYSIYKLTKPNDNGIYIGRTTQELSRRLYQHRSFCKNNKLNLKVYNWFDKTCNIELIEITANKERETEIIKEYLKDPNYEVMNTYVGKMRMLVDLLVYYTLILIHLSLTLIF